MRFAKCGAQGNKLICGTCHAALDYEETANVHHPAQDLSAHARVAYCTNCDVLYYGALLTVGDFFNKADAPAVVNAGAACVKCKEFYPYAVAVQGFTCYGCRC